MKIAGGPDPTEPRRLALREWEEGLRPPNRLARLLLKIIEYEPEAVERVLVRG